MSDIQMKNNTGTPPTAVVSCELGNTVFLDPHGIPLNPQPTPDPLDPLNWSKLQKWTVLLIVCASTFFPIYLTMATIASFFLLEDQFNATYSQVNWSMSVPCLGLVVGPILFTGFADIWGRRAVLILTTALSLVMTGCTTIPNINYAGYMIFRALQGVFAGPGITVGFTIVNDISWEHERAFNIGLWVMALDIGGMIGAVVGGFTAAAGANWAQYHIAIAFGVLLAFQILLLPETMYPRELIMECMSNSTDYDGITRTKKVRKWTLERLPGARSGNSLRATLRFLNLCADPRILLVIFPYVFFQYWWAISILTMEPAAYSEFSTQVQGLLCLGLVVGTVVTELLCSGRLIDWICGRLARYNGDVRTPEMCLWLGYPASVLSAAGLVLWGLSIDHRWHWIFGPVSFALFAAGLQMGNVAVTSYATCAYSEHITELTMFYCTIYNISAFINPWFINYWVEDVGYTWTFATQAITCLLLIPCYAVVQIWGPKLARPACLD